MNWDEIPSIDLLVETLRPGDILFNSKRNGIFIHAIEPLEGRDDYVSVHVFFMHTRRSEVFTWLSSAEINGRVLRDGEFLKC